jgi:uncharacterized protein YndB with AHSA1/START domain
MIEKSLFLPCAPERAFLLLTEQAGHWWPPDRRHTKDPESRILIEARGRFFERAADGTEVELGVVRVFEPPRKLVLDWYPGTGPSEPTHVEILLFPEGTGTRVQLFHKPGPHSASSYAKKAAAYERSWTLVLAAWLDAAKAAGQGPTAPA